MGAGGSAETALSALSSLMDNPVPLVVVTGHSRSLVVCARQSAAWTVTVSEEPRINVLPRRWLDLRGVKVRETWRAAMRAVIGILVFRPGISQVRDWRVAGCWTEADVQEQQTELVWRLRSVYDRAEVIEVLRHLWENGFVGRRSSRDKQIDELGLIVAREEEEREKYWFLGEHERWYTL